jgi:hypothetical protein
VPGFEPTIFWQPPVPPYEEVYWMDVGDASYYIYIHNNNENKGGQMGNTKKIYKKI